MRMTGISDNERGNQRKAVYLKQFFPHKIQLTFNADPQVQTLA